MMIDALPPERVAVHVELVPLFSTTLPVGVGAPLPPLTVTVTCSDWVVVMLDDDGVTVTVGVWVAGVTVMDVDPAALK
jgi:hypothetical protein